MFSILFTVSIFLDSQTAGFFYQQYAQERSIIMFFDIQIHIEAKEKFRLAF